MSGMAPVGGCSPQPNILLFPRRHQNFHAPSALNKIRDLFSFTLFRRQYHRPCLQRFLDNAHCRHFDSSSPPSNYFLGPSLVDIAYQDDQIIVWNVAFCQGHSRQCKIGTGLFCRHSLQASQWCICIRNWMFYLNHSWISEWRNTYPLTPRYF